jgi:hypothetical protein
MPSPDLILLGYGLLAGVLAGGAGGILAGLAGLGGGLVYVPVLYLLLGRSDEGIAAAIMTSLAAVVFTGLFSARAHWRLHHIDTSLSHRLIPWLGTGAALGLWMTLRVPEGMVLVGLAMLEAWVAWDLGRYRQIRQGHVALPVFGLPIGMISGVFGIGGGTMLVPLLRRFVALRYAVGTSAFCGTVMAGIAVMANLLIERHWMPLMANQMMEVAGFLAGVLMVLPFASRFSAILHHTLPEQTMRLVLKIVFSTLSGLLALAALIKLVQA